MQVHCEEHTNRVQTDAKQGGRGKEAYFVAVQANMCQKGGAESLRAAADQHNYSQLLREDDLLDGAGLVNLDILTRTFWDMFQPTIPSRARRTRTDPVYQPRRLPGAAAHASRR